MTVIAWDGRKLAADKQGNCGGYASTCTKIWRHNGMLMGGSGKTSEIIALREWVIAGMKPENYPMFMRDKDCDTIFIVITPTRKILRFEYTCFPVEMEDKFTAVGSGRDYALAAMYLGHDAEEAVLVASHFDPGCGNGVDTLNLHDA